MARFEPADHFAWIEDLARRGSIEAPRRHQERLLREIAELPNGIEIDLPEDLGIDRVVGTPVPLVRLKRLPKIGDYTQIPIELLFEYGGELIEFRSPRKGVLDHSGRRIISRNPPLEQDLRARLLDMGVVLSRDSKGFVVESGESQRGGEYTRASWPVPDIGGCQNRGAMPNDSRETGGTIETWQRHG